jgi:5S rRNA maturation endonuclease (ribonuclease M5)
MVYIIVEGQTDKALVKKLLDSKKEDENFKFLGLKGIDSVKNTLGSLTDKDLEDNIYFAIVDADSGFEYRNEEIQSRISDRDIDYYILPNHQDSGDLETLILQMIENNTIFNCFDTYKKCIETDYLDCKIDNKAKLYAYATIEHNKRPEKYIEEDLDIEHPNFNELKQKLQKLFKEQN